MDSNRIKEYLCQKIEETKAWENDGFEGDMEDVTIRGNQREVEPLKYISEPKRKGKDGLCLLLSWKNGMNEYDGAKIVVHISPEREGGPAVSTWIIDPETGKEKLVSWVTLTNGYFETFEMDKMSIQNFYRHWIEHIPSKHTYKIFRNIFDLCHEE